MHKNIFFPLYFFHTTRFHSVTSNSKSFSPAATLDPRQRHWTRDRDFGPATATLDPRPATRDPRLLVKLFESILVQILRPLSSLRNSNSMLTRSCRICGDEIGDHKRKVDTSRFVSEIHQIWKDSPNVHPPLKNNQRKKANFKCK